MSEVIGVFEHRYGGIVLAHVTHYEWRLGHGRCDEKVASCLRVHFLTSDREVDLMWFNESEKEVARAFIRALHLYWETRS